METMEPTESKESLEELFEQLGNILEDMENRRSLSGTGHHC